MRARRLGPRLPAWRAACFFGGMAILVLMLVSPIHPIGEEGLFWVHMLQHVLVGDVAALLVVLGVTGPILRPALALRWVQRLRVLAHPLVALPLWTLNLAVWHIPAAYEGALASGPIHALEHVAFFTFGALMWAAVIEPLPGPAWFGTGAKIMYVAGVRVVETVLANVLWFSGTVLYPTYSATAPEWGLTALEDQVNAGSVMMVSGGVITLLTILLLFLRMARESELRQALVEAGVDPGAARRAVRFGRGEALATRHGLVRGGAPGEARLVPARQGPS